MSSNSFDDLSNPIVLSYRRIRRKLRNALVVVIAICLMIVIWGVPSIQYSYRAYPTSGIPTAIEKIDADYWNPIAGWKVIRADDVARGCPVVIFLPLWRCFD